MERIVATNSVPLIGADAPPVGGTAQFATDGNPGLGIPATRWPAWIFNLIQEELVNMVTASGQALDRNNAKQLLSALRSGGLYVTDAGAANAYVVNPAIAETAYRGGQNIRMIATNANTGASTINLSALGVKSIVHADGSALQAGDIPASGFVDLTYQATLGKFVMSGFTPAPFTNAASGSLRIPGTPFILQWAAGTAPTPGVVSDLFTGGYGSSVSFNWPATFPNICLWAGVNYALQANMNCTFGFVDRSPSGGLLYTNSGQNLHSLAFVAFALGT